MEKITIMLRVGVTELNIGFENREEAKKCCMRKAGMRITSRTVFHFLWRTAENIR